MYGGGCKREFSFYLLDTLLTSLIFVFWNFCLYPLVIFVFIFQDGTSGLNLIMGEFLM